MHQTLFCCPLCFSLAQLVAPSLGSTGPLDGIKFPFRGMSVPPKALGSSNEYPHFFLVFGHFFTYSRPATFYFLNLYRGPEVPKDARGCLIPSFVAYFFLPWLARLRRDSGWPCMPLPRASHGRGCTRWALVPRSGAVDYNPHFYPFLSHFQIPSGPMNFFFTNLPRIPKVPCASYLPLLPTFTFAWHLPL